MLAKFKESQEKAKTERENYKSVILLQIEKGKEKKQSETKFKKEVPDIIGKFGYPPLQKPTEEQEREIKKNIYKTQKDTLLEQVREVFKIKFR